MDFQEVCDFYDGIYLYDSFRGSLTDFEASLRRRESEIYFVSLNQLGSFIILKAISYLLSGQIEQADELLATCGEAQIFGRRWAFRSRIYRALGFIWKQYPPIFKDCILDGPSMFVWSLGNPDLWDGTCLGHCAAYQYEEGISQQDRLEFRFVDNLKRLLDIHKQARLASLDDTNPTNEEARRRHEDFLRDLARYQEDICNFPMVQREVLKWQYTTRRLLGLQDAHVYLETLRESCEETGDNHGLGLYWILRGDHNASPPGTSPIALNMHIRDSLPCFGGDSSFAQPRDLYPMDAAGSLHPTAQDKLHRGLALALECYGIANTCFESTGPSSIRAAAAALVKRACLSIIAANSNCQDVTDSEEPVEEILAQGMAMAESTGDIQLRDTAQTLLLLEDMAFNVEAAHATRRYFAAADNQVFGLCLGLLALRASLFFRFHRGDYVSSARAAEVSRQLLNEGSPALRVAWIQAMLVQCRLHYEIGHIEGANIWVGHMVDGMPLIIQYHNTLAELEWPQDTIAQLSTLIAYMGKALQEIQLDVYKAIRAPSAGLGVPANLISSHSAFALHWKAWRETYNIRLKYRIVNTNFQNYRDRGSLFEAGQELRSFCHGDEVARSPLLLAKVLRVEVMARCGDLEGANEVLLSIGDNDLIESDRLQHSLNQKLDVSALDKLRNEELRRLQSLELILSSCMNAKSYRRASSVYKQIDREYPHYFTSKQSYSMRWPWQRCLTAGLVNEKRGAFNVATQYFLQALVFLKDIERTLGNQNDRRKLYNLPEAAHLVSSLARRQVKWTLDQPHVTRLEATKNPRISRTEFVAFGLDIDYSKYKGFPHSMDAIWTLESGRARSVWDQLTNQTQTSAAIADLMERQEKWVSLSAKSSLNEQEKEEKRQLDSQNLHSALRNAVQADSGSRNLPTFLEGGMGFPKPVENICNKIPENAIVIYTDLNEDDLLVFAIDHSGVKVSFIAQGPPSAVEAVVLASLSAMEDQKDDAGHLRLFSILLSNILIIPAVERCIDAREHVIFGVSGALSRFPLGMLMYKGDYLLLSKQVSQIPSLSTLYHLMSRPMQGGKGKMKMSVIARPGSVADHERTNIKPLFMAGIEAQIIRKMAGWNAGPLRNAADVTREEFLNDFRTSDFLHISTHGYSDADDPFNSNLLLRERLRVLDMLSARTNIGLVVFSACLSGTGKATASGDVQGFSHAILAAGANAYLGALWKVHDLATMIHMHLFYTIMLYALDDPSIAEAWQFATRMLYNMSTEDIVDRLEFFVKYWDSWESDEEGLSRRPGDFVPGGRRNLVKAIKLLRDGRMKLNFKHPYYWAAFSLIGNGSLIIRSEGYKMTEAAMREQGIRMPAMET